MLVGPGCLMRPWAAARRPSGVLLLVAPRVFWAPAGPAAVCAGGRRPAREPSAPRASLGASSRSPARPRHRPPAPRQVPPAPFTPVVPGRCCLDQRVLLQTSSIRAAFCSAFPALVTNVVNPTAFLRKILVFGLRLTTFVTRVLTEGFKMLQFDDVCNASTPSAVSPCPVGDAVAADWGGNGAFARHEAFQQRVVGVSEPHVVQFPRLVVVRS